jgi:hypothetical protein
MVAKPTLKVKAATNADVTLQRSREPPSMPTQHGARGADQEDVNRQD